MKGFVLAGTASGVGKTVASLAVMHALEEAGRTVQPAKAGPDFIDPSHHAALLDRPSRTLDVWMEGEEGVRGNLARGEGDVAVVEGVMGLYDGDASSTAMVAAALDLPVVLVVDAKAGMESVAATALGFREYAESIGREIEVAGILAQRAHGGRHERGIRSALSESMTYFGRIPPMADLEIPDRHLGLHMGGEASLPREALTEAAEHVRVDRLLDLATPVRSVPAAPSAPKTGGCIALASDEAFSFLYPATRERLVEGATIRQFSPVAGDPVPDCEGIYLPGGYPELFGEELAGGGTLEAIGERAAAGTPVLGECGGLMALAERLETVDGQSHRMAGVLPVEIRMTERHQALDHVELVAERDTLTASEGDSLRGHEFHYSEATVGPDAQFAFETLRGRGIDGRDGLTEYRTLGTYTHVHAETGAFDTFLERVSADSPRGL